MSKKRDHEREEEEARESRKGKMNCTSHHLVSSIVKVIEKKPSQAPFRLEIYQALLVLAHLPLGHQFSYRPIKSSPRSADIWPY